MTVKQLNTIIDKTTQRGRKKTKEDLLAKMKQDLGMTGKGMRRRQ